MNSDIFTLNGKKGLIVGIANDQSIAFGCAKSAIHAGATIAATYQDEKHLPYVQKALQPWQGKAQLPILQICDLQNPDHVAALVKQIEKTFGKLDFLIHSVAFAPAADLHGRVIDCSLDGFLLAMDISCHSLIRLAKAFEHLMTSDASILTMSYYGAEKVIANYNIMGPVKAALDAVVRELASELGPRNIRVNAISPGPMPTRAASGLQDFPQLLQQAVAKSPEHRLANIDEVGALAAFLASDAARAITGTITHVDAGYHIMA